MADEADIAGERMEAEMERRLASRQWSMEPFTGRCLQCDEETGDARWCSVACRDDWERQSDANKRNGRG